MSKTAFEALRKPKAYPYSILGYASAVVVEAMSGTYGGQTPGVRYLHNANDTVNLKLNGVVRSIIVPSNLNPEYLGDPWAKTLKEDEDHEC